MVDSMAIEKQNHAGEIQKKLAEQSTAYEVSMGFTSPTWGWLPPPPPSPSQYHWMWATSGHGHKTFLVGVNLQFLARHRAGSSLHACCSYLPGGVFVHHCFWDSCCTTPVLAPAQASRVVLGHCVLQDSELFRLASSLLWCGNAVKFLYFKQICCVSPFGWALKSCWFVFAKSFFFDTLLDSWSVLACYKSSWSLDSPGRKSYFKKK